MLNKNQKQQPDSESLGKILNKPWWMNLFYAGVSEYTFSEDIRRIFIINLFALVGVLFTFPLGIAALWNGDAVLATSLLFIAALYSANHVFLRYTHNHVLSGNVIIYPLYILMLYLVYTGGVHGTGHVWIYCVPSVALFLQGMKRGLIEVAVFTLGLIVVMFFMHSHFEEFGYHPDLKSRILFSFMVVVFLSTIYEYSMSRFNLELRDTSAKLKEVAETDSLTGLLNRRGMQQRLEEMKQKSLWLLIADVDYFKQINDKYGHDIGDHVLSELSSLILSTLPKGSLSSRWGGEEFLLAVENVPGEQAFAIAEHLRQAIENHAFYDSEHHLFHVTTSFGIAPLNNESPLSEAMKQADKRLYKAKNAGRNMTCLS